MDHHMDTTPGSNADRYAVERPHRPDILSTSLRLSPARRGGSLYSVDADSVSAARRSLRREPCCLILAKDFRACREPDTRSACLKKARERREQWFGPHS